MNDEHFHRMLHWIADALVAQNEILQDIADAVIVDNPKLAKAASRLKQHTDTLKAALAEAKK